MGNLILALDCSLRWTNVAVFLDGAALVSERLDIGRRQAAELPGVVKNALAKAGYSFEHISLVAVTNGPGYFTGIRIGAAYAAALAYGLGIKVVPVSTLQMLKGQKDKTLVTVYAGQERVYAESFGYENNLPVGEYTMEGIVKWLDGDTDAPEAADVAKIAEVTIISDDPEKAFLPRLGREITLVRPDAAEVARAAWLSPGNAVDPMKLRVAYHREPY